MSLMVWTWKEETSCLYGGHVTVFCVAMVLSDDFISLRRVIPFLCDRYPS